MKARNKHVYASPARIQEVAEETKWIGRHDYKIVDEGHLVIYALPQRAKKASKKQKAEEVIAELPEEQQQERRQQEQRRKKTERRI